MMRRSANPTPEMVITFLRHYYPLCHWTNWSQNYAVYYKLTKRGSRETAIKTKQHNKRDNSKETTQGVEDNRQVGIFGSTMGPSLHFRAQGSRCCGMGSMAKKNKIWGVK